MRLQIEPRELSLDKNKFEMVIDWRMEKRMFVACGFNDNFTRMNFQYIVIPFVITKIRIVSNAKPLKSIFYSVCSRICMHITRVIANSFCGFYETTLISTNDDAALSSSQRWNNFLCEKMEALQKFVHSKFSKNSFSPRFCPEAYSLW